MLASYMGMNEIYPVTILGQHSASEKSKPQQNAAQGISFEDVIDSVNPLHHVPIVSNIYQVATGDAISLGAKVLGGGIFGGVIGAAASLLVGAAEEVTGEPILESIAGALQPDPTAPDQLYKAAPALEATPLKADDGQAMLRLAKDKAYTEAKEQEEQRQQTVLQQLLPIQDVGVRDMRDPALGLTNSDKQWQCVSEMHKKLVDSV